MKLSKRTWIIIIIGVVSVLVLSAGLFWFISKGEKESSRERKKSDKTEQLDISGDAAMYSDNYFISETQLQYLFYNYYNAFVSANGSYLDALGLDTAKSLTDQNCALATKEDGSSMTWYEYMMEAVTKQMEQTLALAEDAKANNFELTEEDLAMIDTAIEQTDLKECGIDGLEKNDLRNVFELSLLSANYEDKLKSEIEITEEVLKKYSQEHQGELDESITKSVRHILLEVSEDASAADKAAVKQRAEDLLKEWKEGEATEESFAAMVYDNTDDPGSKETSGLYENFSKGQMVASFEEWAYDGSRKTGDTGIVESDYGYHVMYFVGDGKIAWHLAAESQLLTEVESNLLADVQSHYTVTASKDILKAVQEYAETVVF